MTGGGQGVGRAVCHAFAAAGAAVVVNDYFADRAAEVADAIVAAGGVAAACPFDVSDFAAVVRRARGRIRVIDVLVNNAGNSGVVDGDTRPTVSMGDFAESEPAAWDRYFAVNLYGVLHCTRAVLPGMIERGDGRVITVISEAGRWGEPRMAAYAAAKAGAAGFTRALARRRGPARHHGEQRRPWPRSTRWAWPRRPTARPRSPTASPGSSAATSSGASASPTTSPA